MPKIFYNKTIHVISVLVYTIVVFFLRHKKGVQLAYAVGYTVSIAESYSAKRRKFLVRRKGSDKMTCKRLPDKFATPKLVAIFRALFINKITSGR
jgi:hypothetical protein